MYKILPLFLFALFSSTTVFAQEDSLTVLDRMEERFKSDELTVIMLLQSTAALSFQDDDFNGGRQFGIGVPLLDFKGTLPSKFMYRLQLQLTRTPSVIDALVGYRFSDRFRLITGAQKPSVSIDLDPSPAKTDMIKRARLVGALVNSRETGVSFQGDFDGFYYRAGIYNGTGFNRANDNRFFYTGRIGFKTEEFNLGVNTGFNRTRAESVGNTGLVSDGDRSLYGAYLKYNGDQFFGTVEFLGSKFNLNNTNIEETVVGFYGTLGYHLGDENDLLIRWDHLSFDVSGNEDSDRIVLGWNRQITELVSIQLNGLYQLNEITDNQGGISANFQYFF